MNDNHWYLTKLVGEIYFCGTSIVIQVIQVLQLIQVMQVRLAHLWPNFRVILPRAEGVCTKMDPATGLPKQTFQKKYKKEHKVGRP